LVNICFIFNDFFHWVYICFFLSLFLFSFHYFSTSII
jgi:hypothetical protein